MHSEETIGVFFFGGGGVNLSNPDTSIKIGLNHIFITLYFTVIDYISDLFYCLGL